MRARGITVSLLALIACLAAPGVWGADAAPPRAYCVPVEVAAEDVAGPDTPCSVGLDFDVLLKQAGAGGEFDPESVLVVRVDADGAETFIPHALDEAFDWVNQGTVRWLIEEPAQLSYRVYFDVAGNGPFAPARYIPAVGSGDNFRYNRPDGLDPIHCHGIMPVSGDFNNDGLIDLVSRQIYSSEWGQPWFTFFFWPNVGSTDSPVYADYIRLRADGEVIPNKYNGCDLYDWDGDGLLDLVTYVAVYRNTGDATRAGAPVLTRLCDMKTPEIPGVTYAPLLGLIDHDLDGVCDAFYRLSRVHYDYEGPPPRNFVSGALYRFRNTAGPGETPVFDTAEPLVLAGETWVEQYMPGGFHDVDGDGDLDVTGNSRPLDRIPSRPQYCYWPNVAGKGETPEYGRPILIPNAYNMGGYIFKPVDNDAYHGMWGTFGHRVRYYEHTGKALPRQMPGFEDRGVLKQFNGRCGIDGYSAVDVEDWEGDGDWDLFGGDEYGSIWLIKNVGTNREPVFETPWNIEANGEPIRIMRWHYIQDGNPEYYLGQAKPVYEDWDGDGDRDIIAANNTDRLVLFENIGTRAAPRFTRSEVIRIGDDDAPFVKRCRPSVVDWNGDGVTDVVTQRNDEVTCVFLGAVENGVKRLSPGTPLLDEAGNPFKARQVEVCDWDADGDWDIISQMGKWGKAGGGFWQNVGTNAEPRFKQPVRLTCWGEAFTLSAHEHSFASVDWNGTGKLDLVCGGENGYFFFFRRAALDEAKRPAVTVGTAVNCVATGSG